MKCFWKAGQKIINVGLWRGLLYEEGRLHHQRLVICDDAARLTLVVHDNRVWANREIYLSKEKYFDQKEYLLGDLAFSTSAVMILCFKKGHNRNLSKEQRYFNNINHLLLD